MRVLKGRGGLWHGGLRLGDCIYDLVEVSPDEWRGGIRFVQTDWTPCVGKGYELELADGKKLACTLKTLKDPLPIGRTHGYDVWCRP